MQRGRERERGKETRYSLVQCGTHFCCRLYWAHLSPPLWCIFVVLRNPYHLLHCNHHNQSIWILSVQTPVHGRSLPETFFRESPLLFCYFKTTKLNVMRKESKWSKKGPMLSLQNVTTKGTRQFKCERRERKYCLSSVPLHGGGQGEREQMKWWCKQGQKWRKLFICKIFDEFI